MPTREHRLIGYPRRTIARIPIRRWRNAKSGEDSTSSADVGLFAAQYGSTSTLQAPLSVSPAPTTATERCFVMDLVDEADLLPTSVRT